MQRWRNVVGSFCTVVRFLLSFATVYLNYETLISIKNPHVIELHGRLVLTQTKSNLSKIFFFLPYDENSVVIGFTIIR